MIREQLDLGVVRRTRDFVPITIGGLVLGVFYALVYLTYLIQAQPGLVFAHGYLRPELRPGPFVSDRYSIEWGIVFVMLLNLWPLCLFVYMFYGATNKGRLILHRYVTGLVLFLDLLAIIGVSLIAAFFCNNRLNPGSICNDPERYCEVYAESFPDRCPPLANPNATNVATISDLVVNPSFGWLGIWLSVVSVFNGATLILNSLLGQIARRYNYATLNRGVYRF